jgi:hypothetical protein
LKIAGSVIEIIRNASGAVCLTVKLLPGVVFSNSILGRTVEFDGGDKPPMAEVEQKDGGDKPPM